MGIAIPGQTSWLRKTRAQTIRGRDISSGVPFVQKFKRTTQAKTRQLTVLLHLSTSHGVIRSIGFCSRQSIEMTADLITPKSQYFNLQKSRQSTGTLTLLPVENIQGKPDWLPLNSYQPAQRIISQPFSQTDSPKILLQKNRSPSASPEWKTCSDLSS